MDIDDSVRVMQYGNGLKCYMIIYVCGLPFRVLADTGCSITCMSERMLPPGMPFEYQPSSTHAANKTLVRIVGQIKLNFRFEPNGKQVSLPVVVSPDIDGIIFGLDLLKNFECRWDMKTDSAEIAGSRVPASTGTCCS